MTTLTSIRNGGKAALARALSRIETALDAPETAALLDEALAEGSGTVLGLTGPPGVGKSTLINGLIRAARARGERVAVIAVDPSSRVSRGALLGDRTRFTTDPEDEGVFVRSMAARDLLGGVAEITYPASVLMRALYDLVIVETVGVGQSETQIAEIADLVAFCAQPGSGDALQYMKSGVMEIPDLIIVTKADMAELARRTAADLRGALSISGREVLPEILLCAAVAGDGIGEILDWIGEGRHGDRARREAQMRFWSEQHIRQRFGWEGLKLLRNGTERAEERLSFSGVIGRSNQLKVTFCSKTDQF